ncbi:MAG: hypothetical protein EXR73_13650 [Myxococcales bacterium]|nr:hypothetical protein [Myxococcales bacterium]
MSEGFGPIEVCESSAALRGWELSLGGASVARLTCEPVPGPDGRPATSARLYFDGDVRPETMRQVIEVVSQQLLRGLPAGTCVVYRGHIVSSFELPAR